MSDQPRSGRLTIPQPERERVVAQLSDCFAHDLLPVEEFEFRVDAAYRVATREQLDALVADLPTSGFSDLPDAPAMARRISATLSNVEQSSNGLVPSTLEVRSTLGNVQLDLTRARFTPGVTAIVIQA